MIYIRGNAGDYDAWAQAGLNGWSFAEVLPYFKRAEGFEGGADDYHGADGPLHVSKAAMSSPLYANFIAATVWDRAVGRQADFNADRQGTDSGRSS